jgi:hypothetical protein
MRTFAWKWWGERSEVSVKRGVGVMKDIPRFRQCRSYDDAYYTIQDIRDAEEKTQLIIGHADIQDRLEFMISRGIVEMPWFGFTECERDLINDFCGIKPRFRSDG